MDESGDPLEWYQPSGPMIGRRIGHTFRKHGSHSTEALTREAAGRGVPVGQWTDDRAAEDFIAGMLPQLTRGTKTFDIPAGIGRRINPDGTSTPANRATLVPSGNGVKTAFPVVE